MASINRASTPISSVLPGGMLIAIPIALILLLLVYIASRSTSLRCHLLATPKPISFAEETHSGRILALIILPALIIPSIVFFSAGAVPAVRVSMALVGLVLVATIVAAWAGFEYRFLRHGLKIRAFGFRLRSIPRQQIQSYAPESWSLVRGYGIRGIGNVTRAYVWCNQVVHIRTSTNGEHLSGSQRSATHRARSRTW